MARLDQEREKKLQPERMEYAVKEIKSLGIDILFQSETEIQFMFNGSKINFFPYSGWHTGKTIKDGRGLHRLLLQIS